MNSMHTLDEYLGFLEDHGNLLEVTGASREYEIGGLTELAMHNRPSPALVFDDIEGFASGFRVLTNSTTTPFQWSAAMGFEPTESKREAISQYRKRADAFDVIPPRITETGPIRDNVERGSAVDVTKFPSPVWHEHDGGPFIGTGDMVITRHAETGEINAGVYRIQVHGPNTVTVLMLPSKHGNVNLQSYHENDEPCPVIASVGQPIDLFIAAAERTPPKVNELEYMGGKRGEPIEVVEGEVTGLPLPVSSELALEGHIYPDSEPLTEGPFGEFTGYYSGTHELVPMTVEQVYYQDNPIILGEPPIRPPAKVLLELRRAAKLWDELEQSGIPGITAVNSLPFGTRFFDVVAIDQQYAGHSTQVGHFVVSNNVGAYFSRFTVLLDDDVDVFDTDEVMWAITTRCDPASDVDIIEECWTSPLDTVVHPDQKASGDLTNSQMIIDATRPYHWREEFPQVCQVSDELAAELFEKFEQELTNEIIGYQA